MDVPRRLLMAALLVLLPACGDDADQITDPDAAVVSMPGFSFAPFTTTIDPGESVIFDFPSQPHNVIFERKAGAPNDIQETNNRRVSRTFDMSGTYPYDCTLHPGMSGQVVVR